jgi:hypothetical protein
VVLEQYLSCTHRRRNTGPVHKLTSVYLQLAPGGGVAMQEQLYPGRRIKIAYLHLHVAVTGQVGRAPMLHQHDRTI